MSVSKTILVGNMGKAIEARTMPNGKRVGGFGFATTKTWKNQSGEKQSKTSWHNITVFQEPLVNLLEKYTSKGSKLYIEGEIDYQEYEKDGQTKYITKIIAHQVQLLDSKGSTQADTQEDYNKTQTDSASFETEELEDEIPFS